ncbi:modulation of CheA activity in response to attractants (chemotaxis protein) [Alkalihalophilus pseudofirmus OF4]|uniref:Modulation of CheA activity in response to attractants (Chemotaxis protein) n=1 Tax=Alkalihalophilus pseudofirmus (strain ATCC BAA-2126 / JCM 17055 / OF4) TaxID=398511 RepID=D3FSZ2_ALKPO|nr:MULTISPECIES: chemotaxis protein [Alkalihalophilus]ADC51857.1 modulation of CheA activity in response to attractants (chemotaxis protein) [Alkalihalophilus pseudofirmus OF4]MED1599707.1 chemotaxis protein [Alkalihalophilus marmarensis]OLS37631.1 chemotaxis protein CheV [Alkalihalophilus pseudofirmus]
MNDQTDILLDSGTNELEVVMFEVANGTFGINVLKVREIINPLPITLTPNAHKHVEGVIRLRQEVIPVVDLAKVLNLPASDDPTQDKFIVAELNKMKVAFHVHSVSRIHRISWEQIEKPSELSLNAESHTIGIVKLEEEMSLLLDFEKIVVDINPKTGLSVEQIKKLGQRERSEKRIMIAEDSAILRKLLSDTLKEAGYEKLSFYENGRQAWDVLEEYKQSDGDLPVDLVITDIEMPQMDGHHLTRRIKQDPVLKQLPVLIFSSLITSDLHHKGEKVGADKQISKPEIVELVQTIDTFVK